MLAGDAGDAGSKVLTQAPFREDSPKSERILQKEDAHPVGEPHLLFCVFLAWSETIALEDKWVID